MKQPAGGRRIGARPAVAAGWALSLRVAGMGSNLLFHLLVARRVGVDGAGLFYLALASANVASTLGRLGMENALLRRVAVCAAEEDWRSIGALFRAGARITLLGSAVQGLLLWVVAAPLAAALGEGAELTATFRWMALAVVPLSLVSVGADGLRGLGHLRTSIACQEVGVPLAGSIAIFSFGTIHGPIIAVWAQTIAFTLMAALCGLACLRVLHGREGRGGQRPSGRALLASGLPLMWASLLTFLPQAFCIYLLGGMFGRDEVGRFGISTRLAGLVSFSLLAANLASKQRFAQLHAVHEPARLRAAAISATRFSLRIALPLGAAFLLFPRALLGLAGEGFVSAAPVLSILVGGQLFNVATGGVGALLMMSGHEKDLRTSVAVSTVAALVLAALFLPVHGALGAGIAVAGGGVVQNVLGTIFVRRRLGFYLWPVRSRHHA
ncbi:MAG: oligosaccharide flippase family protein [Planctomycetota bacterium]